MQKTREFIYKLNYEESYTAFFLLSMKWERRTRKILTAVLTVAGAALLTAYYLDSQKIHYFFAAILAILLLYYLIYVPVLKARKGAKAVTRQKGTYKFALTEDGKILSGGQTIELAGDKDARAIETESIFVLRPDRQHTFCLPKRILKPGETEAVRDILKANVKYKERQENRDSQG